jgi:3-isopropylmalate/(R)-2-methylmalate dehydratase small subunit
MIYAVAMESLITGKAYVLGDNVDTDQIIPAQYLSFNPAIADERKFFGMYCMSSVPEGQRGLPDGKIPFVRPNEFKGEFRIIIGGKNFGCGSSREHAPLAIAEAGCHCVIAEFYARIFFRNSVNGGYLVPLESVERLVGQISTGDELEVHLNEQYLINRTTGRRHELRPLGDVLPIIEAGGIFPFAQKAGMIA